MNEDARAALRRLLTGSRVLSLAVVADGAPTIGLLPFVATPDLSSLIVRASGLARHTRGLYHDAPFDALVHAADPGDGDPLQVERVTLRGKVLLLGLDSAQYADDERRYLAAFPTAEPTMGLPDFRSYRLDVQAGRLVTGFAGAVNLTASSLRELLD